MRVHVRVHTHTHTHTQLNTQATEKKLMSATFLYGTGMHCVLVCCLSLRVGATNSFQTAYSICLIICSL